MSESIWNREIEEGLKNFLNSFMLDKGGVPIKVKVRKPDEDFNNEVYPVIFLQNLQQKFNTKRYDPTPKVISRDTDKKLVIVEEAPLPFDCAYQIDFYTLLNSEINTMQQLFLAHTHGGRYFNLPVKDQSGNDWNLLALRRNGGNMLRRDYFDEDTRTYHSTFSFNVQTQLNENVRQNKYMVLGRELSNGGS